MRTPSHLLLAPLFTAAVSGCSGTSSAPSAASDAAAPNGADASSSTPSPDASIAGDDAGAETGIASEGGSSDAGKAPIDPLVVGHTWTYSVTEVGSYPACPSGTHDGSVVSAGTKDGRLAYHVTSLCTGIGALDYSADGDTVSWNDQGTWVLVLDAPVAEGHTWSTGAATFAWHSAGTVKVPAGTFEDCWRAQDTAGPSATTFCRGVGPVLWSYRDAQGNGYDATLTKKNF